MTAALLGRLRAATAVAHGRLEVGLGLLEPGLDRRRYEWVLGRFYGFWRGWEPAVAAALGDGFVGPRRRLGLLAADLAALGVSAAAVAGLPVCPVPVFAGAAGALGSMYVLEGSTLGGRVILRDVAPRLGVSAAAGCGYFAGHGAATGAMWRGFLARLEAVPAADEAAVVAGAEATFAVLVAWVG